MRCNRTAHDCCNLFVLIQAWYVLYCPPNVGSVAVKIMRDLGFSGVIIGLSGDHEESEFIRCGVDKVLLKPINRIVLEEALYLKR